MANKYTIPKDPKYPQTQAERNRVTQNVQNLKPEDLPKPPNIIELGIYLRNLGIRVGEHSLFDGVDDVHKKDENGKRISEHYYDKALDLNITPGGQNEAGTPWAKAVFDELASKLRAAGWTDIIWNSPTLGHQNHMHIGMPGRSGGQGRPSSKPAATPGSGASADASATAAEAADEKLKQFGKLAPNSEKNILNSYRSWNYNIALAGLPSNWGPEQLKDRKNLDNAINDYHIIDSSGKFGKTGTGGVTSGGLSTKLESAKPFENFLNEYNESSPGRFDFFIDDLVMMSSASNGSMSAGPAATFKVEFTVFEPYGMNGFMEALHATAFATSWNSIQNMDCVMKIWFTGYSDEINLPKSEIIPDSTRYFKLKLGAIEADINEEGARYRIKTIAADEITFGVANHLFSPVTVSGSTVFQQIRTLFAGINDSIRKQRENLAPNAETSNIRDYYEVSFPNFDIKTDGDPIVDGMIYSDLQDTTLVPTEKHSVFAKALMPVPGRDSSQPATLDPSAKAEYFGSQPLSGRTPQPLETVTAQVDSYICAADRQIHQSIADIILRSDYVSKDVLQDQIPAAKKSPTDSTITYFKIKTESYVRDYDTVMNRYSRVYRYIVMPFKIHYTEIPGQEQGTANYAPILNQIKREYNYLFTGKNVDILKCNISYNNLFYAATLPGMGNDASSKGTQTKDGPASTVEIKKPESERAKSVQAGDAGHAAIPAPPNETSRLVMTPTLLQVVQSDDPYARFAQLVNDTLLMRNNDTRDNKFTNLELEILGDPFYITSYNADYTPPKDVQTTGEGSARVNNTDVFINMNFRAPRDIYKSDGKPGLADFGDRAKLLPFSGVYRLFTIESYFKGGLFTQRLKAQRGDAQVITLDPPQPAADPIVVRSSVPGSQVTEDSADPSVNRHGIREDSIDFSKFFNRGLPSVGLPGSPSDFTAAVSKTQSAILSKVSGVTAQFSNSLGAEAPNASSLTSGIKISPSALQSIATDANAAAVGVAGSMMEQVGNIQDAAKNLANDMVKQASSLGDKLEQEVSNLEDDFTSAVGDAKNKVQKLQNAITTDPSGIASKLGIDPAKMSGLSKELSTKLTEELNKVADLVPPNANLAGLERAGVVFSNMVGSKLSNLPPLQPGTPAPKPIFDAARVAITDANGNVIPLLNGKANLAALTEINNVKNSLGEVASGYGSRFKSASQTILDKVGTVQLSVDNITALSLGVANPVGGLNENSAGSPAPASVGLGSKENNSGRVDALVQATSNVKAAQANLTLASQVGSKSSSSPLTTLVNNSNIQGKLV